MKQLLLTLILATLASLNGSAQTHVSGNIVGQTWTAAGSPYFLDDDLQISHLVIEPGVTVLSTGDYMIEVTGTLISDASASPCDSIVFSKVDSISGWQGILFTFSPPGSIMKYCRVSNATNSAVRIDNAEPTIAHCTFSNNTAADGGGLSFIGPGAHELTDCLIEKNSCVSSGWVLGGGVYLGMGSLTMIRCIIRDNYIYSGYGVASTAAGGGIAAVGDLVIRNSLLTDNLAQANANGIYAAAVTLGGGVYVQGTLDMSNCIVSHSRFIATHSGLGSVAHPDGSAIRADCTGLASVVNCTFAFNDADCIRSITDTLRIVNSIIWDNTAPLLSLAVDVAHTDIQGGWAGAGNINYDPQFLNDSTLTLLAFSPCINAGDPNPQYNDACFPPSQGTAVNDIGYEGGPGSCDGSPYIPLEVSVGIPTPASTGSSYDGAISLNLWGGTIPYQVSWTGPNGFTSSNQSLGALVTGDYIYTIQDICGSLSDTVHVDFFTHLSERPLSQMTVLPNPFSASLNIKLSATGMTEVRITDALGAPLFSQHSGNGIEVVWNGRTTTGTEVPPGMYFVTVITADGQRYTQRVVKQ